MKDNTRHVIESMNKMIESLLNQSKTLEQAELEFKQSVYKEQLEYCLTDSELDSDDVEAVRDMLKTLFNHEGVTS